MLTNIIMKKTLTIAALFILTASSSFAIYDPSNPTPDFQEGIMATTMLAPITYNTYETQTDFESTEGQICESATDGVNTFMMKEGKVFAGTKVGYPEDFTAEWKCNSYVSDRIIGWSQSDKNEFNTLLERTSDSDKTIIAGGVIKVENILNKYPESKRDMLEDQILESIDTAIFEMIMKYPQDIALPDAASRIYNILKLFRYAIVTR